jgi:ankyrin repeat protein
MSTNVHVSDLPAWLKEQSIILLQSCPPMIPRLDALPSELIYLVADDLQPKDLCSLAATSRQLWVILKDTCHNNALRLACPTYDDYKKHKDYMRWSHAAVLYMEQLNMIWERSSLLTRAVSHGWLNAVRSFLDHGIDPNSHNIHGRRLFHLAMVLFKMSRRAGNFRYLVSVRRPRDLDSNRSGAYDMMKLLLSYGADPNLSDLDDPESTPLSVAAELGMSELVCLLIDKGANVHQRGVLGKICTYCNMEALQCAVDLGVDLDTLDSEGVSLLYHAAENEDVRVLRYLLQACPLAHQINDRYRGITPLLMAITAERSDNIMVLLEYGADVTILHPTTFQSVLHLACTISLTFESVNALVQAGANIGLEDNNGLRPLHRAVIEGRIEVVRAILQSGKSFDIAARDVDGCTALHYAMQVVTWDTNPRRRDTAKLLLAAGAPLRVKDNYGCTPISEALEGRQFEFLYWMVTGDLDFCEKDSIFTDHEKAKWLAYREEEYRLMSLGFDDD